MTRGTLNGSQLSYGVPGALPVGWAIGQAKRWITVQSGDMISASEETEAGYPIIGGNGLRAYTDKTNSRGDTLVIGRVGARCGCVHHVLEDFWASEHAYRVIEKRPLSRRFFFHLLSALDLNRFAIKTAQPLLNTDIVETPLIAVPPFPEQVAIAAFLDRETGKIDALVEEQKRLIELLKEKRQAVISHAVTKGLNPDTKMKPSGVEWLGKVPEHWDVVPVGALFRFVKRQNGDEHEVLSVYRDHGVIPKASRDDNINKTPEDLSKYQTVLPGDLVVNKMKAWQGSLGVSNHTGITSPDYAVFEPHHTAASDYLNLMLRCSLLPSVYRSISNGIRPDQWRVEPDKLKELRVPLPPRSEQDAIARHLVASVGRWHELSDNAERGILLLQERRSALISAAVTGKIDVQETAQANVEAA